MRDPTVQKAIDKLANLVDEINELNEYFFQEGVSFDITRKSGASAAPDKFELKYLIQNVKYDLPVYTGVK